MQLPWELLSDDKHYGTDGIIHIELEVLGAGLFKQSVQMCTEGERSWINDNTAVLLFLDRNQAKAGTAFEAKVLLVVSCLQTLKIT